MSGDSEVDLKIREKVRHLGGPTIQLFCRFFRSSSGCRFTIPAMGTSSRSLRAVICEDDPVVRRALIDTINGLYGIEIAATPTSGAETIAAAAGARPDLVVVDLALAGPWCLRIVPRLLEVAPGSIVVVVVPYPFGSLRDAAVEAGAMSLVELSDLRPLRPCLEHLHTRVHADVGCPCCAATAALSASSNARPGAQQVSIHPSRAVQRGQNPSSGGGSSSSGPAGPP